MADVEPAVTSAGRVDVVSIADVVHMSGAQPGSFLVIKDGSRYWRRIPPPEPRVQPGDILTDESVVVMTTNELVDDSDLGDWVGKGWELRLNDDAARVWADRINERWKAA